MSVDRQRVVGALTGAKAKQAGIGLVVGLALVVALYVMVTLFGVVNTLLYTVLFVFTLTVLPFTIGLFGNAMPGSAMLGKLHIILGALAFGHHYLVEREDRWEWCPGERGQVYVDGEWYEITGGLDKYSVLGWRPFGVIPYKDEETWAQYRIDEQAKKLRGATATDGGTHDDERAGWSLKEPPIKSGIDGTWVLDLKRVYSSGIRKIGDIELIETAEEVIERGQVNESRLGNWGPAVEVAGGIVLGLFAAGLYVMVS